MANSPQVVAGEARNYQLSREGKGLSARTNKAKQFLRKPWANTNLLITRRVVLPCPYDSVYMLSYHTSNDVPSLVQF